MQDISCLVLPIPAHAFFKQAVLQGEIGHDLLQGGGFTTKVLHLAGRRGAGRVARQPALAGLKELLGPAVIHRGGDAFPAAKLRDVPRRAVLPAQCGSSLQPSTADASDAECPSALVLPALYPARISVSSSLLAATMNQKSSLREDPQFVSGVLTGNNHGSRTPQDLHRLKDRSLTARSN